MKTSVFLGALFVVAVIASPPQLSAQEDPQASPSVKEEAAAVAGEEEVDVSKIDQILRGEQESNQGEFFSYDPAGRRDPFRSLLEGRNSPDELADQVRPPGLPGMMVEELTLEGIIDTPSGIMAFVLGRDNVSYIIRAGTKLYNGEVKDIQRDRVIFRQQVNDPKQTRPYEEVVRVLSE